MRLRIVSGVDYERRLDAASRRYRVVFRASSYLRLMERPGDPPATWQFRFPLESGEVVEEVSVRDVVELNNDVPTHRSLEILVDRPARTIDEAVDQAVPTAERVLILLSTAARAPVGSAELLLAYDITPGVEERAFAQWFPDVPIELGKQTVSRDAFGPLWEKTQLRDDERFFWRVMLSMSWHRMALSEVSAIHRFLTLWIGCEALTPLLADAFEVEPAGFGGLRALAAEVNAREDLISEALGLSRDLFHARRVAQPDLDDRARELVPELEDLLFAAWIRLLELQDVADLFPEASIVPWPVRFVMRATLRHEDETVWGHGHHPHFSGTIDLHREDTGDPREVRFGFTPTLTLQNVDQAHPLRLELRGPAGPKFRPMPEPPPLPGHTRGPTDDVRPT